MSIDKSKHSLALLRGIEQITDSLEELELKYSGIIEEVTSIRPAQIMMPGVGYLGYVISFAPVNKSLDFYFELRAVKDMGKGVTDYLVAFKPRSEAINDEYVINGPFHSATAMFEGWIKLIVAYNSVRLSRKDKYAAESAQQFYDDFELVDEDANTAPFDNDKQVVVYKLLDFVKDRLEQAEGVDDEQVQEIIQEIKTLQAHIPAITKAALLKEVSKIYAKVKAFSMQTFVAVYDVAKKEVIKSALYGGLNEANIFFHNLHIH